VFPAVLCRNSSVTLIYENTSASVSISINLYKKLNILHYVLRTMTCQKTQIMKLLCGKPSTVYTRTLTIAMLYLKCILSVHVTKIRWTISRMTINERWNESLSWNVLGKSTILTSCLSCTVFNTLSIFFIHRKNDFIVVSSQGGASGNMWRHILKVWLQIC